MDINKILKADYLDILFEGRNKNYGGYELRKKYPDRMRNAAIIGLGAVVLAFAYPAIASLFPHKKEVKPVANLQQVTLAEPPPIDPKKPPPPPPPSEPPPPAKPTVQFTPPVIKKDEEVREEEKPAEVKELKDAAAGIETKAGDPNGIDPGIVDNPNPGNGAVETPPPPPQIFTFVEQPPVFPGGEAAMMKYLGDHIRYPEQAKEAGIQGKVIVKFVVNEDGDISDAQVVRGVGGGCDQEALRVVKSMPKWSPGKQNGRAVKVYFTLPVTFRLE